MRMLSSNGRWASCDPTDAVSSLSVVFWHCLGLFLSLYLCAEPYCRSVLVSISRFEMRICDFLLEMSFGRQLLSAIVIVVVAECRLKSENLQHICEHFRLFVRGSGSVKPSPLRPRESAQCVLDVINLEAEP